MGSGKVLEFNGASNFVSVNLVDSIMNIYPRNTQVNFLGVPLFDSIFNQIYLKDIYQISTGPVVGTITILFKPGAPYTKIEFAYYISNYTPFLVSFYYNTMKYADANEHTVGTPITACRTVKYSAASSPPSTLSDYLGEDKYFYIQNGVYYPQPAFTGFKINTVF
jgi:hypothetical protein